MNDGRNVLSSAPNSSLAPRNKEVQMLDSQNPNTVGEYLREKFFNAGRYDFSKDTEKLPFKWVYWVESSEDDEFVVEKDYMPDWDEFTYQMNQKNLLRVVRCAKLNVHGIEVVCEFYTDGDVDLTFFYGEKILTNSDAKKVNRWVFA